jgi:hypothetical protein
MRGLTLLLVTVLTLCCSCPQRNTSTAGSSSAAGWQPGAGLPPEWPVKQLPLPDDARLFEGRVDTTQDGGKDVTLFFTSPSDWGGMTGYIEGKLKPLNYKRMPAGEAEGNAATTRSQAWSSPKGNVVLLLVYEEDPAAVERIGQAGFYTLAAKQPKQALAVDKSWENIP